LLAEEKKNPGTVFDLEFIEEFGNGYEELITHLETQDFDDLVHQAGVTAPEVKAFADMLMHKTKIIICWAMGLTQHENGVENVREVVNLLLLKGSIGKEGAGTCPVRGHSNVQGDRTMGIYEKPSQELIDAMNANFNANFPSAHGYDVVDSIKAMRDGKVKLFMAMGGNFISATPDSQLTGEAIQNCDLTVQVSTKLNRAHLVTGAEAIILPCISRSELDVQSSGVQFVSVENSMGVVHMSKGTFDPASEHLMSEPAIVCELGKRISTNDRIKWSEYASDYNLIRSEIEACIGGFENYNERIKVTKGFYLPNGARVRNFTTHNGKANFSVNPAPNKHIAADHYIMMTVRTHDQYNTTIYGMDDRYRGILNERRVILMNADDMKRQGLEKFDVVDLYSHFNGEERKAINFKVVPYDIAKDCVATYFPEANVLIPIGNVAKVSNTPASKFVEISVRKTN
ncbi:MAG: molybdopterin-dependent oxidoreductase alpha subunit, partial [Chitinophagales bacterium]